MSKDKSLLLTKVAQRLVIVVLTIVVVGCSSRQSPAPVVDVQASIPLSDRVKNSINTREYIVKKGETLYSIAWRADVDVRTLAKMNNIFAPYKIFPNQKIYLTKKPPKPSKNVPSGKVTIKSKDLPVKKAVAQNKKQAYGGNVSKINNVIPSKVKQWIWPTKGKVIAGYSASKQGNKGIDIEGKRGTPIKSAARGTVVYAGNALRGYGNLVIVKHSDDFLSAYAHNDKILVKEQQSVNAGDIIAKMGSTDAERVMLHFEVRFRGKSVNPMKYLPKR